LVDVRQDLSSFHSEQANKTNAQTEEKFIVPYERNPHFKGRAELLKALYDKLCQSLPDQYNHRVALYGLGGVGKTQLALEYVYQHYRDNQTYDRVYWVSADSQASFFTALQEIGVRTHCVPETADLKPPEIATRVIRWLNTQESLLFVLDNLDDISVAEEYLLEMAPRRHMLITTRNEHCDDIPAEGLQVPVLDTSEAIELLLRRSKVAAVGEKTEAEIKAAHEIVMELGCLPLAIEQAAAYIREASHDILQFLPSYRQNRKFHHNRTSKRNRMYSKSLATTWSLSFQKVQKSNEGAAHVLKLLAFLNPEGVLIEFLEAGKDGLTGELHEIIADRTRLYDALAELTRFSLVGRQDEVSPRITMHRLVQSIIQDDLAPPEFDAILDTIIGLCESAFPRPEGGGWHTVKLRQLGRAYLEQVIAAFGVMRQSSSYRARKLLWRIGRFLLQDGNYRLGEEVLTKALEIATSLNRVNDPNTLRLTALLALAHHRLGKFHQAQLLQVRVLELMENLFGEEHPDTLRVMGDLAISSGDQGKWEDAQRLQERVLVGLTNVLGPEHVSTLRATRNLANTYRNQGKWDHAQALEERALELMEKLFGQEHEETLYLMGSLAVTYRLRGKWEEAQRLQERVLEVSENLFGREHPSTLITVGNLALAYLDQGKFKKAQRLQERVLELRVKLFGQDHPSTLRATSNLAATYYKKGKWKDAQMLEERVLELRVKLFGPEHPDTLFTMTSLAVIYRGIGLIPRSIELLEDATQKQTRILGPNHPTTLRAKSELAISYTKDGRLDDAITLFESTLESQKRIIGENHPNSKGTAGALEWTYQRQRESTAS